VVPPLCMNKPTQPVAEVIPSERVESRIYFIRGQKVMLDTDLALLYGIQVKRLNEQVQRNVRRFPSDFMFELTVQELQLLSLRSQIATSKNASKRGGRRYRTRVFTEHGVAMLSSVLKSERAILVNIAIIRAFVKLRSLLASHKDLERKLDAHEKRSDANFHSIFKTLRALRSPKEDKKREQIGFKTDT
jgi:hypothetical protein